MTRTDKTVHKSSSTFATSVWKCLIWQGILVAPDAYVWAIESSLWKVNFGLVPAKQCGFSVQKHIFSNVSHLMFSL